MPILRAGDRIVCISIVSQPGYTTTSLFSNTANSLVDSSARAMLLLAPYPRAVGLALVRIEVLNRSRRLCTKLDNSSGHRSSEYSSSSSSACTITNVIHQFRLLMFEIKVQERMVAYMDREQDSMETNLRKMEVQNMDMLMQRHGKEKAKARRRDRGRIE